MDNDYSKSIRHRTRTPETRSFQKMQSNISNWHSGPARPIWDHHHPPPLPNMRPMRMPPEAYPVQPPPFNNNYHPGPPPTHYQNNFSNYNPNPWMEPPRPILSSTPPSTLWGNNNNYQPNFATPPPISRPRYPIGQPPKSLSYGSLLPIMTSSHQNSNKSSPWGQTFSTGNPRPLLSPRPSTLWRNNYRPNVAIPPSTSSPTYPVGQQSKSVTYGFIPSPSDRSSNKSSSSGPTFSKGLPQRPANVVKTPETLIPLPPVPKEVEALAMAKKSIESLLYKCQRPITDSQKETIKSLREIIGDPKVCNGTLKDWCKSKPDKVEMLRVWATIILTDSGPQTLEVIEELKKIFSALYNSAFAKCQDHAKTMLDLLSFIRNEMKSLPQSYQQPESSFLTQTKVQQLLKEHPECAAEAKSSLIQNVNAKVNQEHEKAKHSDGKDKPLESTPDNLPLAKRIEQSQVKKKRENSIEFISSDSINVQEEVQYIGDVIVKRKTAMNDLDDLTIARRVIKSLIGEEILGSEIFTTHKFKKLKKANIRGLLKIICYPTPGEDVNSQLILWCKQQPYEVEMLLVWADIISIAYLSLSNTTELLKIFIALYKCTLEKAVGYEHKPLLAKFLRFRKKEMQSLPPAFRNCDGGVLLHKPKIQEFLKQHPEYALESDLSRIEVLTGQPITQTACLNIKSKTGDKPDGDIQLVGTVEKNSTKMPVDEDYRSLRKLARKLISQIEVRRECLSSIETLVEKGYKSDELRFKYINRLLDHFLVKVPTDLVGVKGKLLLWTICIILQNDPSAAKYKILPYEILRDVTKIFKKVVVEASIELCFKEFVAIRQHLGTFSQMKKMDKHAELVAGDRFDWKYFILTESVKTWKDFVISHKSLRDGSMSTLKREEDELSIVEIKPVRKDDQSKGNTNASNSQNRPEDKAKRSKEDKDEVEIVGEFITFDENEEHSPVDIVKDGSINNEKVEGVGKNSPENPPKKKKRVSDENILISQNDKADVKIIDEFQIPDASANEADTSDMLKDGIKDRPHSPFEIPDDYDPDFSNTVPEFKATDEQKVLPQTPKPDADIPNKPETLEEDNMGSPQASHAHENADDIDPNLLKRPGQLHEVTCELYKPDRASSSRKTSKTRTKVCSKPRTMITISSSGLLKPVLRCTCSKEFVASLGLTPTKRVASEGPSDPVLKDIPVPPLAPPVQVPLQGNFRGSRIRTLTSNQIFHFVCDNEEIIPADPEVVKTIEKELIELMEVCANADTES